MVKYDPEAVFTDLWIVYNLGINPKDKAKIADAKSRVFGSHLKPVDCYGKTRVYRVGDFNDVDFQYWGRKAKDVLTDPLECKKDYNEKISAYNVAVERGISFQTAKKWLSKYPPIEYSSEGLALYLRKDVHDELGLPGWLGKNSFDLEAVISGEKLGDLFQRYSLQIVGYIVNRFRLNEEIAEEIMMEAFEKAIRHADTFRGRSSVYTWLCTIAENNAKDYLQSIKSKKRNNGFANLPLNEEILEVEGGRTPEDELVTRESIEILEDAFDSLSNKHRTVLKLWEDGKSYLEIAEELSIPLGSVMSRLHHARKRLSYKIKEL